MLDFLRAHSNVIVSMVLAAMLGMSLYFPLMAGQLSLASPGFYALGGYVAAVMSTKVFKVANGAHFPIPLLLWRCWSRRSLCAAAGDPRRHPGAAAARHLSRARDDRLCRDPCASSR